MDILNWLYLAKNKFVRTTLSSTNDLMIFGANVGFSKRGDKYQNYAMSAEDFLAINRPYKVFTALLTQSGGDDEQFMGDDIYLVKGVTYNIVANDVPNFNFVPYGAPNNNNGTNFVANETITFLGITDCSLSYNTGAPVVTVLENTIGNVWFTYNIIGTYVAYVPIVAEQKQVVFSPTNAYKTNSSELYIRIVNNSIDGEVEISTTDGTSRIDGAINDLPIEIRVYN
jgi:hypothetical protein